jgi:hypothetical protein
MNKLKKIMNKLKKFINFVRDWKGNWSSNEEQSGGNGQAQLMS